MGRRVGFLQKLMAQVLTNNANLCLSVGSELGVSPLPSTLLIQLQQLI